MSQSCGLGFFSQWESSASGRLCASKATLKCDPRHDEVRAVLEPFLSLVSILVVGENCGRTFCAMARLVRVEASSLSVNAGEVEISCLQYAYIYSRYSLFELALPGFFHPVHVANVLIRV